MKKIFILIFLALLCYQEYQIRALSMRLDDIEGKTNVTDSNVLSLRTITGQLVERESALYREIKPEYLKVLTPGK